MPLAPPSYQHCTPGRTHHMRNISESYNLPLLPIELGEPDTRPDPTQRTTKPLFNHTQPDDVGALVGVGTTRLPLRRSLCATLLWNSFRLPPPGSSALDVVQSSRISADRWELTASVAYEIRARDALYSYRNPEYHESFQFLEDYHRVVSLLAVADVQRFLHAISWLYVELCHQYEPRPIDLDPFNWIIELQTKSTHKWIDRLDEQFRRACHLYREAVKCGQEGRTVSSIWYYLRVLFDMAPWVPTEAYLSTWEVKLPEVQIYFKCCLALATALKQLDHHALSFAFARILWQSRLSTGEIRRSATLLICSALDSPERSSPPAFIDDAEFRTIQCRMRAMPRAYWCFNETLSDDNLNAEDWIHQFSCAKNFTIFDFLTFDRIWTHTSDGVARTMVVGLRELFMLVDWAERNVSGIVIGGKPENEDEVEEGEMALVRR